MPSHRASSDCDFGSSISIAATAATQPVSAKRFSEVEGSLDSSTPTAAVQPANRRYPGATSVFSPRRLSRIASRMVSTVSPPKTR